MKLGRFFVGTAALAALCVPLVSAPAHAQGEGQTPGKQGGQGRQGRRAQQNPLIGLLEKLNLTAEQKTKTEAIVAKFRTDMQAIPQAERREKGRELNRKMRQDINDVLTPEQKKTLREEMEKAQGGAGNNAGRGGNMGAVLLDRMLEELKLDDAQKAKVEPLKTDALAQLTKIREDSTLENAAKLEKSRGVFDTFKAKVRPLLTPTQQTTLDNYRPAGNGGGKQGKNKQNKQNKGGNPIL